MSKAYPTAAERIVAHELHLSELIEWRGEVIRQRFARDLLPVVSAIESTLRSLNVDQGIIEAKKQNEESRGGMTIMFRDDPAVAQAKGSAQA